MSSERQEGGDDTPACLIISLRGLFVNGRGDVYLFKQDWESSTGKSPRGRGFCFYKSDPSGWESTLSLCTEYGASRPQCVDRTASKMTWADEDGVNDRKQNGITHVNKDGCQSPRHFSPRPAGHIWQGDTLWMMRKATHLDEVCRVGPP